MAILDEIQENIARLAEGAGSSVVGIGQRWGAGSGIVLGEGRVLTNAHNVRGDEVTVTFAGGRTAQGTVVARDIDADIAVIDTDTSGASALPWADGAGASIGTPVFALSNPGGRGLRVTFGFVSGVDRAFRGPRGRRGYGRSASRLRLVGQQQHVHVPGGFDRPAGGRNDIEAHKPIHPGDADGRQKPADRRRNEADEEGDQDSRG